MKEVPVAVDQVGAVARRREILPAGPPMHRPYRFAFVMQQVLGHISAYRHLRHFVEQDRSITPIWTEVTFHQRGGLIERLPGLPGGAKGALRGVIQVQRGLDQSMRELLVGPRTPAHDAALFSTQAVCLMTRRYMRCVPSIIVTDVTPMQYDAMRASYGKTAHRFPSVDRVKHRLYVDIYRAARLIVPWSSWVKKSLVADYAVPAEKVVIVPPGVDTERWKPPPEGTRERILQASGGIPRLLFVGGDFERKGGLLLLEWFLAHGRGRCELHVVTRTPPFVPTMLPGLHVHTGLEANDPRLMQLYRESHLFVLPTLADCFGIASIAAMATGMPVVTTNVAGVPEIVEDGEQGFLIRPNDADTLTCALDRLLADAPLRQSMGRRARSKALSHFEAGRNAGRILDLMKGLAPITE